MTAALLREAADMLDRLADAATAGPWEDHENFHADHNVCEAGRGLFGVVASPSRGRVDYGKADAAYIAAMHPRVGKALAAWLRHEAQMCDFYDAGPATDPLTVADAILGTTSP